MKKQILNTKKRVNQEQKKELKQGGVIMKCRKAFNYYRMKIQ